MKRNQPIQSVRNLSERLYAEAAECYRAGNVGRWWMVKGWASILKDASRRMDEYAERAKKVYGTSVEAP